MQRASAGRAVLGLALVLLLSAITGQAAAETHIGVGGGGFFPYSGDSGWDVHLQFMGSGSNGSARFGAELEYRDFDNDIPRIVAFVPNRARLRTIALHFLFNYAFLPDSPVRPYVGLAVGPMAVKINPAFGGNAIIGDGWGGGASALGILGLEVPLATPVVSVYAEGRAGVEWIFYGSTSAFQPGVLDQSVSGIAAKGGLRFAF